MSKRINNVEVVKLRDKINQIFAVQGSVNLKMNNGDYNDIVGRGNNYQIVASPQDVFISPTINVGKGAMNVSFDVGLPTIDVVQEINGPKRFTVDLSVYNITSQADAEKIIRLMLAPASGNGIFCVESIEPK